MKTESAPLTKDEKIAKIKRVTWNACDIFRGAMDASNYKNFILLALFLKYISDIWEEHYEEIPDSIKNNKERLKEYRKTERFIIPTGSSFRELYEQRNFVDNIGQEIDNALEKIEGSNKEKLAGVFQGFKFNNTNLLGEPAESNLRLKKLLAEFHQLNLRTTNIEGDVIGEIYIFLIEKFASDAGKKAGEFYTPLKVSQLLSQLVSPQPNHTICDPACGSGSLLLEAARESHSKNISLYGMEENSATWALCKMNMFLHDNIRNNIQRCNTLTNPSLIDEKGELIKFDIVVANPPFSLKQWGQEGAMDDKYNRFRRGVPPNSAADWAFITHMIETTKPKSGRVSVLAPHGVLFRGASEGRIRRAFIEENILDAVISLPANLFPTTGIPVAILVFDKSREKGATNERRKDVLFIDASKEYKPGKNQNSLQDEHIEKILKTYKKRKTIQKYSRKVTIKEIIENDYNLNIPRYIDTYEEEEIIDIAEVQQEIEQLQTELTTVQKKMKEYLQKLPRLNNE